MHRLFVALLLTIALGIPASADQLDAGDFGLHPEDARSLNDGELDSYRGRFQGFYFSIFNGRHRDPGLPRIDWEVVFLPDGGAVLRPERRHRMPAPRLSQPGR